jgi:SAM-dependent methyltransferase
MRRVVRPELLDSNQLPEQEVRKSLADLAFVNRWFGGIHTTTLLLRRAMEHAPTQSLTLLDVGAASGDGPARIQHRLQRQGITLRFALLDRNFTHFSSNKNGWRISGDALYLPFRDNSFDVVTCSLLVHHLEPDQIRQLANEGLRVCRRAFFINDLRRSWLHLALVYAGLVLFRSYVTRHDSVASVRRAYTPGELQKILCTTTARRIEIMKTYLYRMGVIAWK